MTPNTINIHDDWTDHYEEMVEIPFNYQVLLSNLVRDKGIEAAEPQIIEIIRGIIDTEELNDWVEALIYNAFQIDDGDIYYTEKDVRRSLEVVVVLDDITKPILAVHPEIFTT